MNTPARLAPIALCLLALAGCKETSKFVGECTTDSACPVGSFCKKTRGATGGVCACRSDEGCAAGEICNSQNVCQDRQACRSNSECPKSTFCDLVSGDCLAAASCGNDVHCAPGQVCDSAAGRCTDGCLDSVDCPLYQVCEGASATRSIRGRCVSGKCDDKTFCPYGYVCRNDACVPERDPTFCEACDRSEDCGGDGENYCLINSSYDPQNPSSGSEKFCGMGCESEDECPSGYRCGGVILLTQNPCTSDAECGGNGRRCVLGEGDLRGFCTCVESADCGLSAAPPTCNKTCGGLGLQPCQQNGDCLSGNCAGTCQNPSGQRCSNDNECQALEVCRPGLFGSRKVCATDGITPCETARDCACSAGRCVQTGRACSSAADCDLQCVDNGCLLGSACAPIQGLLCPDVRVP